METLTVSKDKDGMLISIDEKCRILGILNEPGIGRILTRTSGIFTTFRYNVAKIIDEKIDGKNITYTLESLPDSVQEKIFNMYYLPTDVKVA